MTGTRLRRPWVVAITVSLLALSLAGAPLGVAQDTSPRPAAMATPPGSMVFVIATTSRDGQPARATAVGVVVDPSGLILAPANVVAPDAPGVAVLYGDPGLAVPTGQITVSLVTGAGTGGAGPSGRQASVVAVDGYLDLAILRVNDLPGTRPLRLVALPLATGLPASGDPVTWATLDRGLLATPSERAGTAGDPVIDERIGDDPAWLTTSLQIGDAFPGGAIVDAGGALVAYPTWSTAVPSLEASGRPAALIRPLLSAALEGTGYTSPYVVAGTGEEALTLASWVTAPEPCDEAADQRGEVTDYPTGATRITALFTWSGFTDDEDTLDVWYDADPDATDPVLLTTPGRWVGGPVGDCYALSIFMGDGSALADGAYGVRVLAGGRLHTVGDASTTIGRQVVEGINVTGRVVDADTGKGVKEAWVVLLVPGADIQGWLDNPTEREIAASGVADKRGYYETSPAIEPGEYPFLVYAEGYRIIGGTLDLTEGGILDDLQLTKAG